MLSTFLNGHSDLSGTMALRIEKAFGVKMSTLCSCRRPNDIAGTRKPEAVITVRPYRPIQANQLCWGSLYWRIR